MDRKTRGRQKEATEPPVPAPIDHDEKIRALRGASSAEGDGTDALIAERRRERDLEDREAGRGPVDRL